MIWSGLAIHGYAIQTTGVKKMKPLFMAFNQRGCRSPEIGQSKRHCLNCGLTTMIRLARAFFKKWYWWATHSRLKPVISVAKMLKNHLDNIMTYLKYRITNATEEGFKGISKNWIFSRFIFMTCFFYDGLFCFF